MAFKRRAEEESNVAETLAAAFGTSLAGQPSYKTVAAWSQTNFSIIANIVNWLKERHLSGDFEPLTLDEILDETEPLKLSKKTKNWLQNEVLESNPRIRVVRSDKPESPIKYQFKPVIDVTDRKSLRKFLMEKYQSGEGATWMDDILESVPHANRAIKWLVDNGHALVVTRALDKRKVVYYNEGKTDEKVDEEFMKVWRSISVEGLADDKIEEYLEKHGIQSIQDISAKRMDPEPKKRKVRRQNRNFKPHNEHMKGILENYTY